MSARIEITVHVHVHGNQGEAKSGGLPNPTPITSAIDNLINAKTTANLRPSYLRGLKAYLLRFARFVDGMRLDEISPELVEEFASECQNPGTRAANLGRLSSLFSFCRRRRLIADNPVEHLEKIRVDRKTPFIFTVDQCRRLLTWTKACKPRFLPYLVLALFCGVRPDCLAKLTWANVDLGAKTVRIDATVAKTRRRRTVHIPDVAVEWLKLGGDLPIHHTARRRWEKRAREVLGLNAWPQDSLRHTAASMMLARDHNASLVATELGNSPGILARHYVDLVPESTAGEFWRLLPETKNPASVSQPGLRVS